MNLILIIQVGRQIYYMRKSSYAKSNSDKQTKPKDIEQFYDPLQPIKPVKNITAKPSTAFITLFDQQNQQQQNYIVQHQQPRAVNQDPVLMRILAHSMQQPRQRQQIINQERIPTIPQLEPFCFNANIKVKYPQTPHFKNQLQSPFGKFNAEHRLHIESLKQKLTNSGFASIDLNSNPCNFRSIDKSQALKYFVGISLKFKQLECINASRALLKLGCYVEPFNQKAWKKYIESEEQQGYIDKACILSKTAFLLTKNQDFARSYLSNGQKCSVNLNQMRGILNSTESPQIFQKSILVEIGKLTLKHLQIWKGLKILFQICQWNEYRLPVCALIIFLAKYLENIGQRKEALYVLKKSFGRGMSKLQVYTTYLQIKIREQNGELKESLINQILQYSDFISSENRFRLYLQIAELLFKKNDIRYQIYIQKAYHSAKMFCAPGTGCNKILRQIYYTVLRWHSRPPPSMPSDISYFQVNRHNFITTGTLEICQFTDWKFYLHFGLNQMSQILMEASKKWSYTGRLIAEWIHSLRQSKYPREVLKLWRQKIDQVPKSGELWCEGGRIYAQLHDYQNASKCFKAAIHFTPQYGDSFIEQLRIYLMRGKFLEANQLKKIMLVSQPFYGHVWSFLRESNPGDAKLCLKQMWDLATEQINASLYRENIGLQKSVDKDYRLLTAYPPYNDAYLRPDTPEIRRKLFASYQQLDNKN